MNEYSTTFVQLFSIFLYSVSLVCTFVQLFCISLYSVSLVSNFVHLICTDRRTPKRVQSPFSLYSAILNSLFHPFMFLNPLVQPNGSLPFKECIRCTPHCTYTTPPVIDIIILDNTRCLDTAYVCSASKLILVVTLPAS